MKSQYVSSSRLGEHTVSSNREIHWIQLIWPKYRGRCKMGRFGAYDVILLSYLIYQFPLCVSTHEYITLHREPRKKCCREGTINWSQGPTQLNINLSCINNFQPHKRTIFSIRTQYQCNLSSPKMFHKIHLLQLYEEKIAETQNRMML